MADTEAAPAGRFLRVPLGEMHAVALFDGTSSRSTEGYVRNVAQSEVDRAFAALGFPEGSVVTSFTALALEAGERLVLIDAGLGWRGGAGTGLLNDSLAAAGHRPGDVDLVIVSHFHMDHIAGLLAADGTPAYPAAPVMVPGPEWRSWMSDRAEEAGLPADRVRSCRQILEPLRERITTFEWDEAPAEGVTALRADGHTPGHTAFAIRSGEARMVFMADVTNNPHVFARQPDWQAAFDIDPAKAVETRRAFLGEAADRGTLAFFFHAPFPGFGHLYREGQGFGFRSVEA